MALRIYDNIKEFIPNVNYVIIPALIDELYKVLLNETNR